jgi:hypothetical protein
VENENLVDQIRIVAEGTCPEENLDVRTSNAALPVHFPKGVIETKESGGIVIIFNKDCSSKCH